MSFLSYLRLSVFICGFFFFPFTAIAAEPGLSIRWEKSKNFLYITGPNVSGGEVTVNYLEAYCRPGSTDADWRAHTRMGHATELVAASDDLKRIELRCTVTDGVQAK